MSHARHLLVLALVLSACSPEALDYCENSLREYYSSPDGRNQAVVFDRSCGRSASTTNLSILPAGSSIPDSTGNAYTVPGAVVLGVQWNGRAQVAVTTPAGARPQRQQPAVGGITLRYTERAQ
jgi:hypothetical protein